MVRADVGADDSIADHDFGRYETVIDRNPWQRWPRGPGWLHAKACSTVAQAGAFKQGAEVRGPTGRVQIANHDHRIVLLAAERGQSCELIVAQAPRFTAARRQ